MGKNGQVIDRNRRAAGGIEDLLGADGGSGRLQHCADRGRISPVLADGGGRRRTCGRGFLRWCMERGWKLRELSRVRHSLEDIYIRLTRPESEEERY